MDEDNIERLHEIYEKLRAMNVALEALNRVMSAPEPDPDDVAFLHEFANGTLEDEDDEWPDDEGNECQSDGWIDDTWDDALKLFPYQLLITHKL